MREVLETSTRRIGPNSVVCHYYKLCTQVMNKCIERKIKRGSKKEKEKIKKSQLSTGKERNQGYGQLHPCP